MWLSVAVHQARQLSKVVLYSRRMRNHGLENPRLYQSAHDLQRRDNQMILDFYKNTLERNLCLESAQVLDIGCGSGDSSHDLLLPLAVEHLGAQRLVATDLSPAMVEFARESYPHRSICYDVYDVSSTESTELLLSKYGYFDVVFSLYALHWVRDLGKALKNIRRLLRPPRSVKDSPKSSPAFVAARSDSEFLLAFLALNPAVLVYHDLAKKPRWAKYFNESHIPFGEIYCQKDLEGLAASSGLGLRSCEVLNLECQHPSMETLRESAVAVCPFYQSIPKNVVEEFERDLVEAYLRLSEGTTVFNYQLAVLHGFAQ